MANLQGKEVESRNAHTSLVYDATHKGESYLPFMNRSFISFTYGGKHIEDFNLIASIKGDRLTRRGYADFDSIITSYDVGQGQYHWGTYYKNNSLSLTLVTDGMDLRQLDDFVWWFAADLTRELILSEHPNRAIMARMNSAPQISLLPFEKKIDVQVGELVYKTSTTNYKGEIEIEFVMDDPHWYSVINIFGYLDSAEDGGMYHDTWIDANGEERSVYDDPDAVKIAYEDGIPISGMLLSSMLLGDNTYATVRIDNNSCIATMAISDETENSYTETYVSGAVIAADEHRLESYTHDTDVTYTYIYTDQQYDPPKEITVTLIWPSNVTMPIGRIAGPKMSRDTSFITVGPADSTSGNLYFYYAGTAPAPVKLTFNLTSAFEGNYISVPSNKFVPRNGKEYSTITIESNTKLQLCFTTPGIYTAYNSAVKIFSESVNLDWPSIAEKIRDFVYHSGVRAWAMKILDYLMTKTSGNIMSTTESENACSWMKYMFYGYDDEKKELYMMPATYMFNSKNGEAIGQFRYRTVDESIPTNDNQWENYRKENIIESEENIGDMLKSNYLIIRDRNMPKEGIIQQWSIYDKTSSHRFYHDMDCDISNVRIEYRNMYL